MWWGGQISDMWFLQTLPANSTYTKSSLFRGIDCNPQSVDSTFLRWLPHQYSNYMTATHTLGVGGERKRHKSSSSVVSRFISVSCPTSSSLVSWLRHGLCVCVGDERDVEKDMDSTFIHNIKENKEKVNYKNSSVSKSNQSHTRQLRSSDKKWIEEIVRENYIIWI